MNHLSLWFQYPGVNRLFSSYDAARIDSYFSYTIRGHISNPHAWKIKYAVRLALDFLPVDTLSAKKPPATNWIAKAVLATTLNTLFSLPPSWRCVVATDSKINAICIPHLAG